MNGFVRLRKWRGLILGSLLLVSGFATATEAATWTHSVLDGYDVWYLNGTSQKFRYNLTNQQWSHYSTVGSSWYTISATGRANTFIGDGAWYDMGNGFRYQYSDGYNKGTFKDGLKDRLMYKYGTGQWWHVGDTTHSWQVLGTGGHNGTFIGDGAWYDLGNGFTYKYSAASDKGTFKDGSAYRFLYNYTSGQWYDTGDTLSWQALGNAGLTAAFMGDGRWHDLGNGFDYLFSRGYQKSTFRGAGNAYFLYKYNAEQWWHSRDAHDWYAISALGVSAGFLGDGRSRDLGNGWQYQYAIMDGDSVCLFTDGVAWFGYNYTDNYWGSWGQNDPVGKSMTLEEHNGNTADFIANGRWHLLDNGFQFQYSLGYHKATFREPLNRAAFLYKYHISQWWHYTTAWEPLSAEGTNSEFVADHSYRMLGYMNGAYWIYCYTHSGDDELQMEPIGRFYRCTTPPPLPDLPWFYNYYNSYRYDSHQWITEVPPPCDLTWPLLPISKNPTGL